MFSYIKNSFIDCIHRLTFFFFSVTWHHLYNTISLSVLLFKTIQGLFHLPSLIKRQAFFKFCIKCDSRGFFPLFFNITKYKKPCMCRSLITLSIGFRTIMVPFLHIAPTHTHDSVCQITTSFPKVLPINRDGNEWIRPYASVRLLSDKAYRLEWYWDICVLTICTRCSNAFHTQDTSEASFYTWRRKALMPTPSTTHVTLDSQLVALCYFMLHMPVRPKFSLVKNDVDVKSDISFSQRIWLSFCYQNPSHTKTEY